MLLRFIVKVACVSSIISAHSLKFAHLHSVTSSIPLFLLSYFPVNTTHTICFGQFAALFILPHNSLDFIDLIMMENLYPQQITR